MSDVTGFQCPTCKTVNPNNAKHCMNCGTWLLDTIHEAKAIDKKNEAEGEPPLYICPICGKENQTFVKYCSSCGTYPEMEHSEKTSKVFAQDRGKLAPRLIIIGFILLLGYFAIRSAAAAAVIFFILSIIAFVSLIIGLIRPKAVVRWGTEEKRTRGRAAMIYGLATLCFFIVFVVAVVNSSPSSTRTASSSSPSVSAPATSSPAQPAASIAPDYKLNETAIAGKLSYIVSSVNITNTIGTNPYMTKTTDNQYVVLKVKVINNDNDARAIDTGLFTLIDSQGKKYSAMADADMYVNPNSSFFLQQVNPGTDLSGYIVFETPKGIKDVKLHCSSGFAFASGSEAVIDLGL